MARGVRYPPPLPRADPASFTEPFAVKVDAEGNLVWRTVRQMLAEEVLAAISWQEREAARLKGVGGQEAARARAAIELKLARLLFLIRGRMPHWQPGMPLREALRRYWPS